MAREAFTDSQVVELSKRFVCVTIDVDKQPRDARRFAARVFPTVELLASDGRQLVEPLTRKQPASVLATQMRDALREAAEIGDGNDRVVRK